MGSVLLAMFTVLMVLVGIPFGVMLWELIHK